MRHWLGRFLPGRFFIAMRMESDVIVPAAVATIISYLVYGLFLPRTVFRGTFSVGVAVFHKLTDSGLRTQFWRSLPVQRLQFILSVKVSTEFITCLQNFQGHDIPSGHSRHCSQGSSRRLCTTTSDRIEMLLAVLSTGYGTLQKGSWRLRRTSQSRCC